MDYADYYKPSHNGNASGWRTLSEKILGTDQGIYHLTLNVSVAAAGIALLAAVLLLAVSASGGASSKTFQEAKKWVMRVIVISVLIFAVTGLITLVGATGLD